MCMYTCDISMSISIYKYRYIHANTVVMVCFILCAAYSIITHSAFLIFIKNVFSLCVLKL